MVKIKETPFWNTASTLWGEVSGGHKRVTRARKASEAIAKEFHGPFYMGSGTGHGDDAEGGPENHAFEYIISKLPELVYNNPRVTVRTRRNDLKAVTAEPLRHALNRWSIDHQLSELLELVAVDMCIDFGVVMVTLEDNPGASLPADQIEDMPDQVQWPVPQRISPSDYTVDAKAWGITKARFQGHRFVRSKRSMMAELEEGDDAGWDRKAVYALETKNDHDRDRSRRTSVGDAPHRDDVVLWEIWVPEAKLEDEEGAPEHYNGVIYTLVDQQETANWIRKPRPYTGPPSGPYVIFGAYNVREEIVPLGPLMAHRERSIAVNRLAAANLRSAMRYKRFAVADDSDPDIADKVQSVEHDEVVLIQGLDKGRFIPSVEIGGVTPQMNAHEQMQREALHRLWGSSDAQQGNTQSGETATAVAVAEAADNARDEFLKHKFHQAAAKVLKLAAAIMWENDTVLFTMGQEADEAMLLDPLQPEVGTFAENNKVATWQGGGFPGTFPDLQFEIEPFSMERSSAGVLLRRQLEMNQLFLETAPAMIQNPHVRWKEWWTRQSDLMNTPGGEDLVDWALLEELQQRFMQVQADQQTTDPKPRMAGEVGKAPPPAQDPMKGARRQFQGQETGAVAGAASQF